MGTKIRPGVYDCYRRALPDEPLFVLLGRDDSAPDQTRNWAHQLEQELSRGLRPASDHALVVEARSCAFAMERWRLTNPGAWRQPGLLDRVEAGHREHMSAVIQEKLIETFGSTVAITRRNVDWKAISLELADLFPVSDFYDTDEPPAAEPEPPRQVVAQPPLFASEPQHICTAIRQSDEMYCPSCGLRWGVDDLEPPECRGGRKP